MTEHHALLLEGSYEWARTCLPPLCREPRADVDHYVGTRMGIDEVRRLIEEAYKTPLVEAMRVFVLSYPSYTEEAQNALLKLLEEPPRTARFYIVTERAGALLPTLRSRLVLHAAEMPEIEHDHEAFFSLPYGERLERIADRAKAKDETWLSSLMSAFELHAHDHHDPAFLRAVVTFKPYFHMPGASRKMILEHLALMLPAVTKRHAS